MFIFMSGSNCYSEDQNSGRIGLSPSFNWYLPFSPGIAASYLLNSRITLNVGGALNGESYAIVPFLAEVEFRQKLWVLNPFYGAGLIYENIKGGDFSEKGFTSNRSYLTPTAFIGAKYKLGSSFAFGGGVNLTAFPKDVRPFVVMSWIF